MFGDPQGDLGKLEHLAALAGHDLRVGEIRPARLARDRPIHTHLVRADHLGEMLARRAGLLTLAATRRATLGT